MSVAVCRSVFVCLFVIECVIYCAVLDDVFEFCVCCVCVRVC